MKIFAPLLKVIHKTFWLQTFCDIYCIHNLWTLGGALLRRLEIHEQTNSLNVQVVLALCAVVYLHRIRW